MDERGEVLDKTMTKIASRLGNELAKMVAGEGEYTELDGLSKAEAGQAIVGGACIFLSHTWCLLEHALGMKAPEPHTLLAHETFRAMLADQRAKMGTAKMLLKVQKEHQDQKR